MVLQFARLPLRRLGLRNNEGSVMSGSKRGPHCLAVFFCFQIIYIYVSCFMYFAQFINYTSSPYIQYTLSQAGYPASCLVYTSVGRAQCLIYSNCTIKAHQLTGMDLLEKCHYHAISEHKGKQTWKATADLLSLTLSIVF